METVSAIMCRSFFLFLFFFSCNWEGKMDQLSSSPAIHFSKTMGPQLPRLYSRFYCALQIGVSLTTVAFNWEIIKKQEQIQSFSPGKRRRRCPNEAALRFVSGRGCGKVNRAEPRAAAVPSRGRRRRGTCRPRCYLRSTLKSPAS